MARTSATHAGIRSKRTRSPSPDLDALFDKELEMLFGDIPQLQDDEYVFNSPPRRPSPNLFDSPVDMVVTEKAIQFQPVPAVTPCVFAPDPSYVASQQVPQVQQMPQYQALPFNPPPSFGYAPQEPYYNGQNPFIPANINYQMEPVQTGLAGQSVMITGETQMPPSSQQESLLDLLNDNDTHEAPLSMGGSQLCFPVPKYIPKLMLRGAGGGADKFFEPPYGIEHMDNNDKLIGILAHGSDKEVEALSNLSCACPPVKYKCDAAMDSALFVRTTHMLITMHGVSSLADVFRHVGMLGDRCCVQCKKPGMGCVAGTFQCINCLNKRGKLPFGEGFDMWLANGQLARHAEKM
jgi:hypothetical protein